MIKNLLQQLSGFYIHKQSEVGIGTSLQLDVNRLLGTEIECILDIGANVGQSALAYVRQFKSAKIYAFEPFAETIKHLEINTRRFNEIVPVKLAASDFDGEIEAYATNIKADSTNSLREGWRPKEGFKTEIIKCVKLDTWLHENRINSVSLMKLDVEGLELKVISGARTSLSNSAIKLVLIESGIGSSNTWNTPLCHILECMNSYGYELIGLHDTSLVQLPKKRHYTNALFVSPELIESLPPLVTQITNKSWPFQSRYQ